MCGLVRRKSLLVRRRLVLSDVSRASSRDLRLLACGLLLRVSELGNEKEKKCHEALSHDRGHLRQRAARGPRRRAGSRDAAGGALAAYGGAVSSRHDDGSPHDDGRGYPREPGEGAALREDLRGPDAAALPVVGAAEREEG